jgi:O-antigen ligase
MLMRLLLLTGGLGTLTIATNFLDPINLPKLIAIVLPLPWIVLYLSRILDLPNNAKNVFQDKLRFFFVISLTSIFVLALFSPAILERRLLGVWGRNNGLLTATVSIFLAWSAYEIVKRNISIVKLMKNILIILIPTALYGLIQVMNQDPIAWSSGTMRIFATFGNTNFASAAWGLGSMISASLFIFGRNSQQKFLSRESLIYIVSFFTFTYLSFMTKSIQGLFAITTFFGIIIFLKLWSSNLRVKKISALVVGLIGLLIAHSIFFSGPLTSLISSAGSLGFRKIYWNIGMRIFAQSPIFGVGVDSYGDYYRSVRTSEMATITSIDLVVNNAHNTFIQTLATMGILGFVSLILPVIVTLVMASLKIIRAEVDIKSGVFAIFIALWLMASFSIDNISITLWNWIFLGFALGTTKVHDNGVHSSEDYRKKAPEQRKQSKKLYESGKVISGVLSLALLFLMWSSASADRDIAKTLRVSASFSQPESINARLLSLGEVSRLRVLDAQHYLMISNALVELQQVPQSIEVLSKGLVNYPRDLGLWDSLAYSLEKQGQIPEAVAAREKQVELDPRHARIWSYLAQDYVKNNDLVKAKFAAQKSLENLSIFAPSDQETIRALLVQLNLI